MALRKPDSGAQLAFHVLPRRCELVTGMPPKMLLERKGRRGLVSWARGESKLLPGQGARNSLQLQWSRRLCPPGIGSLFDFSGGDGQTLVFELGWNAQHIKGWDGSTMLDIQQCWA